MGTGRRTVPKWKSPIFSDIRNAIGENVVFSQWKGRPYMRAYVKPANPKTAKQMAVRYLMTELVKRYQSLSADADVKAVWNVEALPYVISGFNIFVKWGMKSQISVSPTSGTAPLDVVVTYTCGIPLAKATMLQFDQTDWTIVIAKGSVEAGADKTKDISALAVGTYNWFLADDDVLKSGDETPQAYQGITMWKPDKVNGVVIDCECVVSA